MVSDPLYPESVAYHEAGHIVVAAVLGLQLSRYGIHVDAEGRGMSYYKFRKPINGAGGTSSNSDVGLLDTVVATMAGLIAQRHFHPTCSPNGASDDVNIVDSLLGETFPNDILGQADIMRMLLEEASKNLVISYWSAIEAVAVALWRKPLSSRVDAEPDPGWSLATEEKKLTGVEIRSILQEHNVLAKLR